MWITEDGDADGTGADIFYVVSTWEDDWKTADGKVCHYADVWNPEHHVLVATNYSASEYPPFRGFLNVGDIHSCEPCPNRLLSDPVWVGVPPACPVP